MSVSDFERGLPVKKYEESLPVQRRVKLPKTKAEEEEDFGIGDDGGCPGGETCERITKALLRANSGGKTKKRRRKRRKKSRKKRKRKTRRKLRKRKKKTKRRRRR